jgi:hypothetical protein
MLWMVVTPAAVAWQAGTGQAAQDAAGEETPVAVFHAYTNLIQVPVLVLNSDHKPLPPIAEKKFAVSLDGGPAFTPTHVRAEGEDPITLSILLEVGGSVVPGCGGECGEGLERAAKGGSRLPADHALVGFTGLHDQADVFAAGAARDSGDDGRT